MHPKIAARCSARDRTHDLAPALRIWQNIGVQKPQNFAPRDAGAPVLLGAPTARAFDNNRARFSRDLRRFIPAPAVADQNFADFGHRVQRPEQARQLRGLVARGNNHGNGRRAKRRARALL